MTHDEFIINQLAQRIAQLEADKAGIQADNAVLSQQLKELKEKDDKNVNNE